MKINNAFIIASCCVFVLVANACGLTMFDSSKPDGFYSQMVYVSKIFDGGGDLDPLYFVHLARLLVVSPFYFANVQGLPEYFEAVIYILYLMPVLSSSVFKSIGALRVVFIFVPVFLSYRTALGMCAMSYIFIIISLPDRRFLLFGMSALLANLSSGLVLSWALIILFNSKIFYQRYKKLWPVFLVVFLGFIGSVIHKVEYMLTSSGIKVNGNPIERSTVIVSFLEGNYARFFVYSMIMMLLFCIFMAKLYFPSISRQYVIFFVPAVINCFFEGIGLMSYLFVLVWFFYSLIMRPKDLKVIAR